VDEYVQSFVDFVGAVLLGMGSASGGAWRALAAGKARANSTKQGGPGTARSMGEKGEVHDYKRKIYRGVFVKNVMCQPQNIF
jgi:hypothetical protein